MHGTENREQRRQRYSGRQKNKKRNFFIVNEHIFKNFKYISHNLKLSQNWHAKPYVSRSDTSISFIFIHYFSWK